MSLRGSWEEGWHNGGWGGHETMRYVFGDYSLDTQRYELRRAGDLIPLGPQVFNALAYLVVHRDRVVSRDELFARLGRTSLSRMMPWGAAFGRHAVPWRTGLRRHGISRRPVGVAIGSSRRCRSNPRTS